MADVGYSPAMRWFWELLKARLEIKVLQREVAELKAQLADRGSPDAP